MGVVRLSGPDARSWLQGMVTNDVEKLADGEGCYAGHLTAQGKLVAQATILAVEDGFLLLLERVSAPRLAAAFDRLIVMEDVQIQDLSSTYEVLGLFGDGAKAALAGWSGKQDAVDRLYQHRTVRGCRVVLTETGYDAVVPREEAESVLKELKLAGFVRADKAAWEVQRVEAGIPEFGIDLDETTVLPELGGRGISYEKGCYIGQEVVARIKYLGHVNRKFVGFLCEGQEVPHHRTTVQLNGKDVGYTTSAVMSERFGRAIALGFVSRMAAEPGTAVNLVFEGKIQPARISSLPF
jgi:folate-binding protein YgfZ